MSRYFARPAFDRADEYAARRAEWDEACARFDEFPKVGEMPDGEPIRMLGDWGEGVREASGYICSPIAYSCRQEWAKKNGR